MDTLGFAILLFAAIVLSFAFTYLQHLGYSRTLRAVAVANDRPGVVVVSGRGKGALRGCVVVLAVDVTTRKVIDARSMTGSTVLARFRPTPQLNGSLRSAEQRATSRWMADALREATTQFHETARNRSDAYRTGGRAVVTPKGSPA